IESLNLKDRYTFGTELSQKAKSDIKEKQWWFYNSQLWPAPFYPLTRTIMGSSNIISDSLESKSFGRMVPTQEGIEIHETYEKYGLTSQLITAQDSNALYDFLSSKGLDMPQSSRQVFNHYIGDKFSFVITEITNKRLFSGSAAVYTTFPTNSLYYPLVLTSVYESHRIPTKIYVDGYVNPKIDSIIEQYTDVKYYVEGNVKPEFKSDDDLFKSDSFEKYTLISMDPPSKYLKKDLIMSKIPPVSVMAYNFVYEHLLISCGLLFILFSVIASLIVSVIFKKDKKIYIKAGFFNVFSIIGYFVALNKLNKDDKTSKEIKTINKNVFFINCIISAFTIAFLIFIIIMTVGIGVPRFYDPIEFLIFAAIYVIPVAILYSLWKTHNVSIKAMEEFAPNKLKTIKIGSFADVVLFSVIFMSICLLFFTML
ncbi:MAG: hypothetical protein KAQ92_00770, partial [Candidatus Aenigmarchaeota archaeon]|nr:hypothetical protein [Candidatus Aenigmarchaeota archaeon]